MGARRPQRRTRPVRGRMGSEDSIRNTPVETVRDVAKQPHSHPMVTMAAIRSDGSVESVTSFVSSGVAQVDEAVRRILAAKP